MRKTSVLRNVGLGGAAERLAGSLVRYANFVQSGALVGIMVPGLVTKLTESSP